MTLSALNTGILGIAFSFLPQEILTYITPTPATRLNALTLQIFGALYFGFAMVNWTARANLVGGIYSRPIATGNFTLFAMGALALIKVATTSYQPLVLLLTIFYILFAVCIWHCAVRA